MADGAISPRELLGTRLVTSSPRSAEENMFRAYVRNQEEEDERYLEFGLTALGGSCFYGAFEALTQ